MGILKISLPENEPTVHLKSASFIVILLLHKGLTHIQSQIKPQLLSSESFTLIMVKQLWLLSDRGLGIGLDLT